MSAKKWKALVAEANSVDPVDEVQEVYRQYRALRIAPVLVFVAGVVLLAAPTVSVKLLGAVVAVLSVGVWVAVMQSMNNRLNALWLASVLSKEDIAPENKVGEFTQVFGKTDDFK